MSLSVLLWDVDGTLLDFLAAEKAAIRTLFREFGFGECTDEMIRRYSLINKHYWEKLERKEMTKPEILVNRFRDFFAEAGADPGAAEAFNERYQLTLGDTIVFRDRSYELVKALRGRVRQYAVSNGTVTAQTKKLTLSGLGALMDGVFLSEELGYEKPDPRFFEGVFRQIGPIDPSRTMIVGDSLTSDIQGGLNAGIRTCWYNPEHQPLTGNIKAGCEIADLHEILGYL